MPGVNVPFFILGFAFTLLFLSLPSYYSFPYSSRLLPFACLIILFLHLVSITLKNSLPIVLLCLAHLVSPSLSAIPFILI